MHNFSADEISTELGKGYEREKMEGDYLIICLVDENFQEYGWMKPRMLILKIKLCFIKCN